MVRSILATATVAAGLCFGAAPGALAQGVVCAQENGFCRVPFPARVIYGVPGRTTSRVVGPPGILCSNDQFGDPARGVGKICTYVPAGGGGGFDEPRRGRGGGDFDEPRRGRGGGDFDEPRRGRGAGPDCRELREACLRKDELGEQGEGNCRRYRQLCR